MDDQQKAARPPPVTLTPEASAALESINLVLREVGFRVKTSALIELALVELNDQMSAPGKAVELVRRRVPPHSVIFPP